MKYKKYPCENCKFGIYMTVEETWWCLEHLMYVCGVERNVGFPCELFQESESKRMKDRRKL